MITPKSLSIILVRVLSLYLILQGLSILPAFYSISSSETFLLEPQYVSIAIGVIIWLLANPISRLIVSKESRLAETTNGLSKNQIEVLVMSFIGLILIVHAIPNLASLITYRKVAATLTSDPIIEVKTLATYKSSLVYNIVKILIGAYLLLFSRQFMGLINKLRNKKSI